MSHAAVERDVQTPTASTCNKVPIRLQTGRSQERVIEIHLGASVATILKVVAAERGCCVDDMILVREGDPAPLTSSIVVDETYPHTRRHHVHHPGELTVTVYYQAFQQSRDFKRFEAVKDVLDWAIQVFDVDPAAATEFVLTLHGEKEELPEPNQIGHLAEKDYALLLDLVRGDIANGSS